MSSTLLAWLRADEASKFCVTQRLPFAVMALETVAPLGNDDELKTALRALLARTEVARVATRLAVRSAVTNSDDDLVVDAAGAAAGLAHAAAMARIVVSACSRFGSLPRECRCFAKSPTRRLIGR